MRIELSICIPTFNRANLLDQSLRLLTRQCQWRPVEICVSDNASEDHTQEVLKRYPEVRQVRQSLNIGIDRNVLAALRMAQGRYVLPIGDDELIPARGVDSILAALRAGPHMLLLNGWRRGKPHLPPELPSSFTDHRQSFEQLWDKMPLGGFAIRREYSDSRYAERYLGTYHAYSGAAWDYLRDSLPVRIDCMRHPVVEFREVTKSWQAEADRIRVVEIPRWFDLIPAEYGEAVARSRRKYLSTWGHQRGNSVFARISALLPARLLPARLLAVRLLPARLLPSRTPPARMDRVA